ncbi:MAG: RICIN domain-containing protein [Polyangiaceae bacterium]
MKLMLAASLVPILFAFMAGCAPTSDDSDEDVDSAAEALQVSFFATLQSRVGSNLCMAVANPSAMAGAELATCATVPAQKWRFMDDGTIRSNLDGDLCLTAANTLPGAVTFAPCMNIVRQRWSVSTDASVRNAMSTYACLEATGAVPGADVRVAKCDHSTHQEWVKRDIRETVLESLDPRVLPHIDPNPVLEPGVAH